MAKRESLRALNAAVAHAELIPAGRPLTREEIELLDHLAVRLRRQFFGDRSAEITALLRRVSAVRTGKRDTTVTAKPSAAATSPAPVKKRPAKPKEPRKAPVKQSLTNEIPAAAGHPGEGFGRIYNELTRFAATKRRLKPAELARLDELVTETATLAKGDRYYRKLHQRAKLIQKGKTPPPQPAPPQPEGLRAVLPAGLASSSRLTQGGREVLGGLPSSRRGH
ncbi:hypothetical protein [Mycobacteroides chelonae]|uniref:hypothetical protein n=1 Tax=Mycobacteroides chelonae TaxID=1774 RepID=UPI000918E7C9|nr:hypothetical protein [Mycobacteroides chelonae]OHU15932.1 hypothetical protein BKG75_12860 [Mycobacteroides chelonae]